MPAISEVLEKSAVILLSSWVVCGQRYVEAGIDILAGTITYRSTSVRLTTERSCREVDIVVQKLTP